MIRFTDALVLAHTKLRVHKVRTAVAVSISGLLFGLIAAAVIFTQGVFTSVDNFSQEGLNNRTILNLTKSGGEPDFNEYLMRDDPTFVAEVEAAHKLYIEKKKALARKYGISYESNLEDPSLVSIDPETKKKTINEQDLASPVVKELSDAKREAAHKPFDINAYIEKYQSATVIQRYENVQPTDGTLVHMKEGKENFKTPSMFAAYDENTPMLSVLNASLAKPFITNTQFDPARGEIPAIVPYSAAEKALGLKALGANASNQEKYDRLQDVRSRINEIEVAFCYRNTASQAMLSRALGQQEEIRAGASDANYNKPSLVYNVPTETSCGAISVASDTRTVAEKQYAAQLERYEKELGTYIGEPVQQLITVRGIGIAGDFSSSGQWSIAEVVKSVFASTLGYGTWAIPEDILKQVPIASRPADVFVETTAPRSANSMYGYESYLVEFSNKEEARKILGGFGAQQSGDVYAMPFGSGVLIVDELKAVFQEVFKWTFLVVGGVAVIILAGIVGRTVADGRRESSVFRAIGASRLDIGGVYGVYVILLALRIIFFAAILAIAVALVFEIMFWQDATLGARLSFAATDITKEFHLFSLSSPYLFFLIGVILGASIIASIIPILLGARRNPIKDMRNE